MLAHVVIPHHHHEDEVCIVSSHCENDHDTHNHKESNHSHKHHGNGHFEYCVLNQIVVLPASNEEPEYKVLPLTYNPKNFASFCASLSDKEVRIDLLGSINRHTQNNTSSFFSQIVRSCISLRAPPIV